MSWEAKYCFEGNNQFVSVFDWVASFACLPQNHVRWSGVFQAAGFAHGLLRFPVPTVHPQGGTTTEDGKSEEDLGEEAARFATFQSMIRIEFPERSITQYAKLRIPTSKLAMRI